MAALNETHCWFPGPLRDVRSGHSALRVNLRSFVPLSPQASLHQAGQSDYEGIPVMFRNGILTCAVVPLHLLAEDICLGGISVVIPRGWDSNLVHNRLASTQHAYCQITSLSSGTEDVIVSVPSTLLSLTVVSQTKFSLFLLNVLLTVHPCTML